MTCPPHAQPAKPAQAEGAAVPAPECSASRTAASTWAPNRLPRPRRCRSVLNPADLLANLKSQIPKCLGPVVRPPSAVLRRTGSRWSRSPFLLSAFQRLPLDFCFLLSQFQLCPSGQVPRINAVRLQLLEPEPHHHDGRLGGVSAPSTMQPAFSAARLDRSLSAIVLGWFLSFCPNSSALIMSFGLVVRGHVKRK